MRHGDKIKNLGRTASHRRALLSNMACELITHKRIVTTLAKAKALPGQSIMIGDSIEVDIEGAANAGIDQVHVNHISSEPVSFSENKLPTYTVYSLKELEGIF